MTFVSSWFPSRKEQWPSPWRRRRLLHNAPFGLDDFCLSLVNNQCDRTLHGQQNGSKLLAVQVEQTECVLFSCFAKKCYCLHSQPSTPLPSLFLRLFPSCWKFYVLSTFQLLHEFCFCFDVFTFDALFRCLLSKLLFHLVCFAQHSDHPALEFLCIKSNYQWMNHQQ